MNSYLQDIQQNIKSILGHESELKIAWLHPDEFAGQWKAGESSDPDCRIVVEGNKESAVQRDFCALRQGDRVLLVADPKIPDSAHNFVRWFVPRELLKQHKYVLHSSCVVNKDGQAYLFLGPSGAGKTTIASLALDKLVLGDDMNTIKIEDQKVWVCPSGLGQQIEAPRSMRRWFPVKKVFWLKQSNKISAVKVSRARAYRYFSASFANLFWPYLPAHQLQQVQETTQQLINSTDVFDLEFPKTPTLWQKLEDIL